MPEFSFQRKTILIAKETVYGTDEVPTGGANAIQVSNLTIRPFEAQTVNRNLEKPYLGLEVDRPVVLTAAVEFDVEAAGAGAVDSAVKYNVLFLVSAFAETVTPSTGPVEYDLISDRATMDSASIYFNADGVRHALLGLRGSVRFDFPANDIPHVHFTGMGLWVLPADVALPTPDFTGFQDPLEVDSTNTTAFTLHGYSAELAELTIDLANQLTPRFLVGSQSVRIIDRAPTGSCLIRAPAMATKNFFDIAEKATLGALQIVHGPTTNLIQLDAPQVQITGVEYEDGEGDLMLRLGLRLIPTSAGDDELKITTK